MLDLCQRTLFYWSRCWGLSDCSTIIDFLLFLRIGFWFLYFFLLLCCSLFTTVNFVYLLFFSINNITFLPIKKKKKNDLGTCIWNNRTWVTSNKWCILGLAMPFFCGVWGHEDWWIMSWSSKNWDKDVWKCSRIEKFEVKH